METVEILIRIPKQDFDFIKDEFADGDMPDEKDLKETTYYAIANGIVLPKGHGNLTDKESLIKAIEQKAKRLKNLDTINGLCGAVSLAYEAEIVIEADKEVAE